MWLLLKQNPFLSCTANSQDICSLNCSAGMPMTDIPEISLSTALLASQSAAHSAARAVQAVATATARSIGHQLPSRVLTNIKPLLPNVGQTAAVCARAIVAANQAAHSASLAAKVISTAIGRHGKSGAEYCEEYPVSFLHYGRFPVIPQISYDLCVFLP